MRTKSRRVLIALSVLGGCASARPEAASSTPPSRPAPMMSELAPALAPLGWWPGDWVAEDGSGSEHWVAAAGAIYGVALHGGTFEVMVIDDGDGPGRPDGVLRLFAMPGGERSVEFRARTVGEGAVTFANDAHDFPRTITYRLAPDRAGLVAVLGGGREVVVRFRRGASQPAPELEAADRAFAADTGRRGVEGWIAAFDPEGGMMRKAGRIAYAAIAEAMAPTLTSGRLDWAPIASGKAGALGFTVGKASFVGQRPEDGWRSTYVTIWRRQPDGAWKVLFDTGRIVHDV